MDNTPSREMPETMYQEREPPINVPPGIDAIAKQFEGQCAYLESRCGTGFRGVLYHGRFFTIMGYNVNGMGADPGKPLNDQYIAILSQLPWSIAEFLTPLFDNTSNLERGVRDALAAQSRIANVEIPIEVDAEPQIPWHTTLIPLEYERTNKRSYYDIKLLESGNEKGASDNETEKKKGEEGGNGRYEGPVHLKIRLNPIAPIPIPHYLSHLGLVVLVKEFSPQTPFEKSFMEGLLNGSWKATLEVPIHFEHGSSLNIGI